MKSALVIDEVGFAKFALLVTLVASTLSSILCLFTSGNVRNTEKSRFQPPGPRNWFSRLFPKQTHVGWAQAAGSKYTPSAPILPTFVTGPTRSAVCVLFGVLRVVASAVTVNGVPLNAWKTPFTCQLFMSDRSRLKSVAVLDGTW